MVERLDPDRVHGFGSRAEAERWCDQDYLIRTGRCPNGHGFMTPEPDGQTCPTCNFATNRRCELESQ